MLNLYVSDFHAIFFRHLNYLYELEVTDGLKVERDRGWHGLLRFQGLAEVLRILPL